MGAVHRRVRPDRARDVGADRGQRGQRRGGGRDPADRRAEVDRVLPGAGGRGVRAPGGGPGADRLRRRRGRGQPARRAAAQPAGPGLRRRAARRAVLGRLRGPAGHARPGRPGGGRAGRARRADECDGRDRDRPRAPAPARLPGPPPARPAERPAPAGDDRPGQPVRATHPHGGNPDRGAGRGSGRDVRARPRYLAEHGVREPEPLCGRAGADTADGGEQRARRRYPDHHRCRRRAEPGDAGAHRAGGARRPARHGALHRRGRRPDQPARPVGAAQPHRLHRQRELDRLRHDQRALVRRPASGGRQHRVPHRHRRGRR